MIKNIPPDVKIKMNDRLERVKELKSELISKR